MPDWRSDDGGITDRDNVIQFPAPDDGYDGITCACGSAWFRAHGVNVNREDRITGYTLPLRCIECDTELWPSKGMVF